MTCVLCMTCVLYKQCPCHAHDKTNCKWLVFVYSVLGFVHTKRPTLGTDRRHAHRMRKGASRFTAHKCDPRVPLCEDLPLVMPRDWIEYGVVPASRDCASAPPGDVPRPPPPVRLAPRRERRCCAITGRRRCAPSARTPSSPTNAGDAS